MFIDHGFEAISSEHPLGGIRDTFVWNCHYFVVVNAYLLGAEENKVRYPLSFLSLLISILCFL